MGENKGRVFDMSTMGGSSIKKDLFNIKHYSFMKDHPFDDLVTTTAPYLHFQILKPKDEEQKQKAIDYFQENNKLFVAWTSFPIFCFNGGNRGCLHKTEKL